MNRFWIGDFRCRPLQTLYELSNKTASDNTYIINDLATYTWFATEAINKLDYLPVGEAEIIIMLGFHDCVNSCIWDAFDIDSVVANYSNSINNLIDKYPNNNIYLCTVTPIDGDYAIAEATDGILSAKILNEKIKTFNKKIRETCLASFIDCYDYLDSISISTRDGVHYTMDTSKDLEKFILYSLGENLGTPFVPRLEAPVLDMTDASEDMWISTTMGGDSPFLPMNLDTGSTLPNDAAYAWGRFYEILGSYPTLSQEAAGTWYDTADDYKRGETPVVGSIICWSANRLLDDNLGRVAVVEKIIDANTIVISGSGWGESTDWWTRTIEKTNTEKWSCGSGYIFQGFIYCPITDIVTKDDLCTKNDYDEITVEDMEPNARYIWNYLGTRGWTINAVAGLLGNLQRESRMSPCVWESSISGSIINADGTHILNTDVLEQYKTDLPGYGLVQWTPYTKYEKWCTDNNLPYWDIDSQLQRIEYEVANDLQWRSQFTKGYDLSFNEFIKSTKDASWLAEAFAFCYERPAEATAAIDRRREYAETWYNYLINLPSIGNTSQLYITDLRLNKVNSTSASLSFMSKNNISSSYRLYLGDSQIKSEILNTVDNKPTCIDLTDLAPVTTYKLVVEVETTNQYNRVHSDSHTFTTPQDYPENIKRLDFKLNYGKDNVKDIVNNFTLNIVKPDYLGYWKKSSGYDMNLIINGKTIATKTIEGAKNIINTNFSLKSEFNYVPKITDSIQLGIQTWVRDSAGEKLLNTTGLKTSLPIYLLMNPITIYLNRD